MTASPLILCDTAEERSGIPDRLHAQGCIVECATLPTGDYLVSGGFAIERKAAADFSASLLSGRLYEQLHRLADSYEYAALLLEGDSWEGDRKLKSPIVGALYHWISLRPNLSVLYSPSTAYSARLLADLARREQSGRAAATLASIPAPTRRTREPRDILLCLPGVGAANADRLLERFGNVAAVATADEPTLQAVIGKKRGSSLHTILNQKGTD